MKTYEILTNLTRFQPDYELLQDNTLHTSWKQTLIENS